MRQLTLSQMAHDTKSDRRKPPESVEGAEFFREDLDIQRSGEGEDRDNES